MIGPLSIYLSQITNVNPLHKEVVNIKLLYIYLPRPLVAALIIHSQNNIIYLSSQFVDIKVENQRKV